MSGKNISTKQVVWRNVVDFYGKRIYPGFLKGEGLNRLMASIEKCINQKEKKAQ